MRASDRTPSAYRISEIFAAGTQPTQYSDVWSAPRSAKSFTVTHNEDGYPLLVIEAGDNACLLYTSARKLEEVWLALPLAHQFSKAEILELYLNYIYFDSGAYGVQAAAQTTFGVEAWDLTPAQAAALAAAIKAPASFSLASAPEANLERRTYILGVMRDEGMLTQEAYDQAVAQELTPLEDAAPKTRCV